jgi:hypothetical protein
VSVLNVFQIRSQFLEIFFLFHFFFSFHSIFSAAERVRSRASGFMHRESEDPGFNFRTGTANQTVLPSGVGILVVASIQ